MNGKKLSTLLIVLAVMLGLFFVVKLTKNTGRSKSYHSELVTIDTAAVSKIEILSPDDTTLLEKSGDSWKIDNQFQADPASVSSLLGTLQTIIPGRLASRSEDTWKDYQVDESGTRVVAYESGKKVLDIVLGRFNVEGQRSFSTYVRLADESDVYVAPNFMKMSVSTGSASYRNDDVLRLVADSIQSVDFNYPAGGFTLEQGMSGWEMGGMLADSASVAKYFQGLRYLNSRNFGSAGTDVDAEIVFNQMNGESITVTTYQNGVFGSSQNAQEYWEDKATKDKIFKQPTDFVVPVE